MRWATILVAAAVALAGCLAQEPAPSERPSVPSPTPGATRSGRVQPSSVPTLAPTPSPPDTLVRVGDWTASCGQIEVVVCVGVGRLFVNNLARSWKKVFAASDGLVRVTERPMCPPVEQRSLLDDFCWQATADTRPNAVCMVVARLRPGVNSTFEFGQAGGDLLTGRAMGPPPGWPRCD